MSNELVLLRKIEELEKLIMRQPEIGGVWQDWTPGVASTVGTITSYTASARYIVVGKMLNIYGAVTIINNGTGSGEFYVGLPFIVKDLIPFYGRENDVIGNMLQGRTAGNIVYLYTYNNSYPAVTGYKLLFAGMAEIA
jgi:hypothetical protein